MKIAGVFLIALLALLLPGCGGPGGPSAQTAAQDGKLKITCTVGMIGDLVQRIGGSHVAVNTLLGPGTDPHLYKPSEADARALNNADVVFYNGLHLEGKMTDVLKSAAQTKKHVYPVAEKIPHNLIRRIDEAEDPHVWFDVSLWQKVAEAIRDGLVAADEKNAAAYKTNAAAVDKELSDLHQWCKSELAGIPKERRVLVTAHDAFNYFGRAYDLEVEAIQGISTDDQASLQAINKLIDLITVRKIKAVFVESSVPEKSMRALVEGCKKRGHDVVIGGQLFSDAMDEPGKPGGSYVGMVRENVNTIVKALK